MRKPAFGEGTTGLVLIAVSVLGCAACNLRPAGPMQHDSARFDRDKSEYVRVNLDMGAGDMRIDSGADKLMTANFDYNVPEWKPEATYSATGGVGYLSIHEPGHANVHFSNTRDEWNIQLNRDVPIDFVAHMGAGDAKLNLGGLTLRRVEMNMGAGDLNLDLRGAPKKSYDVRVHGGVGDARVYVPNDVGIDATAAGGVGDINADGLNKDGHRYTNDALGKSSVTIRLDIEGGVGDIHLIAGK